jgi:hypothetical protein
MHPSAWKKNSPKFVGTGFSENRAAHDHDDNRQKTMASKDAIAK